MELKAIYNRKSPSGTRLDHSDRSGSTCSVAVRMASMIIRSLFILQQSLFLLILMLDSVSLLATCTTSTPRFEDVHKIPTSSSPRGDEGQRENGGEMIFDVIHRHYPHMFHRQSHQNVEDFGHREARSSLIQESLKRGLLREKSLNREIKEERMTWSTTTVGESKRRQLIGNETVVAATGGEYVVQMQLGTPPKPVLLILDTGSGLTWVQCKQCVQCSPQQEPLFDPSMSSSYSSLSCQSTYCGANSSFSSQFQCNTMNNTCEYGVQYDLTSFTTGIVSKDKLQLPDGSMTMPDFLFGCGIFNMGDFLGNSGLLGLSRSNISFPSQLGMQQPTPGRKFTTCLADVAHNFSARGFISFGNSTSSSSVNQNSTSDYGGSQEKMVYTPFAATPFPTQFYYLELKNISVDGTLLPINSSAFGMDRIGNGGTVIDSGTTLTLLNPGAYGVLRDTFRSAGVTRGKLPNVSTGGFNSTGHVIDTCYQFSVDGLNNQSSNSGGGGRPEASAVPSIVLHFAGDVNLVLPPDSVLFPFNEGLYCLAFASTLTDLGINVIGNIQQQNLRIEYDLEKSRIGFESVISCTR